MFIREIGLPVEPFFELTFEDDAKYLGVTVCDGQRPYLCIVTEDPDKARRTRKFRCVQAGRLPTSRPLAIVDSFVLQHNRIYHLFEDLA